MSLVKGLWDFMKVRKKYWLPPIIILFILIIIIILAVIGETGIIDIYARI